MSDYPKLERGRVAYRARACPFSISISAIGISAKFEQTRLNASAGMFISGPVKLMTTAAKKAKAAR